MNYVELFKDENDQILERYELVMERIEQIAVEDSVSGAAKDYFKFCAGFIQQIKGIAALAQEQHINQLNLEELQNLNRNLYEDIAGQNYEESYANPTYALEKLGENYAKSLCFLYTELRGLIPAAFEGRLYPITTLCELFVEIYNYFEEEDAYTHKDVKQAIYYYVFDYLDVITEYRSREQFDPTLSFARDIILDSDLTDLRYLYQYGEYITENEIGTANFLNGLSQQQIDDMADTYVNGLLRGYEEQRLDIKKKKTVEIRFRIGFERMIGAIIKKFREIGLETILYRTATSSICKRQHLKIGYHSTSPNRQYDFDHRFDQGLYLDKAFIQRRLVCQRQAFEQYKELAKVFAGPSVVEVYGEKQFEPINKTEVIYLDEKQQKLNTEYSRDAKLLMNEYVKSDEISFVMIDYPIPEIGPKFEEIFAQTVKVNTLDNETYKKIQQNIIDVLDTADYVHVVGSGVNQTDIKVNLWDLKNPSAETLFENCTASVNIPVGEVFTSPQLTGTQGTLHVSQVFLHELEYKNLKLEFKDGKITAYSCSNFETEEDNLKYVKENLLYNHETLPIGEFAIGTNTTAYMMGRNYNISAQLPILIAEKTGPHFAIGDTCYSMSEDHCVYNPDGKEIIARQNECSMLRTTDIENAYFGCHTDITIPYDELKEISAVRKDGTTVTIISDGRFVLPGTEELNKAFEQN